MQRFVARHARPELHHENIVQIIDCGRIDDVAFICMEFVEGLDLQKGRVSCRNGAPPGRDALLMIRDLCRGPSTRIRAASRTATSSPVNIMLTPDGVIKIMDFGLAHRRRASEAPRSSARCSARLRTPEQGLLAKRWTSARTVFGRRRRVRGVGGRRPSRRRFVRQGVSAVLTADPDRHPARINLARDGRGRRILRGMLTKDAARRNADDHAGAPELGGPSSTRWACCARARCCATRLDPQATAQKWHTKRLSRHLDQGSEIRGDGTGAHRGRAVGVSPRRSSIPRTKRPASTSARSSTNATTASRWRPPPRPPPRPLPPPPVPRAPPHRPPPGPPRTAPTAACSWRARHGRRARARLRRHEAVRAESRPPLRPRPTAPGRRRSAGQRRASRSPARRRRPPRPRPTPWLSRAPPCFGST